MKTTAAARTTAAKSARNQSTSGRSGASKSGKITVTIDGALAEEIRKEADGTGMHPLSLLRQRIKLGSLVIQDTEEAKSFRMDVAERAFREAGKPIPKAEESAPENTITAMVRPQDAALIKKLSTDHGSPPWIVAAVLASIGSEVTCSDRAAAVLRTTPNHVLWRCIYREAKEFTTPVPVFFDESELFSVEETAAAMGRTVSDWIGTLIRCGVEVIAAKADLSFMTQMRQFKLLADSSELRLRKEIEDDGSGDRWAVVEGEGGEA